MMIKIFSIFLGLCLIVFLFYIYKLHALALEGNEIFEYRCTNVNPHLIAYKNSFLKYADYLNTYPNTKYSQEQAKEFVDGYIKGMQKYLPEETNWLEMQNKFINRWDFQLFEPWYIKEAGLYQLEIYKAYRDDAKQILNTYNNPELGKNVKPGNISEERVRRDTYTQKYFELHEKAAKIGDWRKSFGRVPIPKGCTSENVDIPDTSGSINWSGESPTPFPPIIPINFNSAS